MTFLLFTIVTLDYYDSTINVNVKYRGYQKTTEVIRGKYQ
jgi:hypothetical protein